LLEKEKGETEAGEILKKIVSEIRETLNTQIQQKAKSIHVNS
jgi:hypothetical protein